MKTLKDKILAWIKILLSPIIWFCSSFDGPDGKASGKKFTAAFLTILTGVYSNKVHDTYSLYAFIALLITLLMMWGIISSHNIITFTRALKNKPEDKTNPE